MGAPAAQLAGAWLKPVAARTEPSPEAAAAAHLGTTYDAVAATDDN